MCQLKHVHELGASSKTEELAEELRWKLRYIKNRVVFLKNKVIPRNLEINTLNYQGDVEVFELNEGDKVQIRSKKEIQDLLAGNKVYKRCPFNYEMFDHCGNQYTVLKIVHYFYDEVKQKLCKCKDLVVLDGVVCSGKKNLYLTRCDLNCFFFWHKDFLNKL